MQQTAGAVVCKLFYSTKKNITITVKIKKRTITRCFYFMRISQDDILYFVLKSSNDVHRLQVKSNITIVVMEFFIKRACIEYVFLFCLTIPRVFLLSYNFYSFSFFFPKLFNLFFIFIFFNILAVCNISFSCAETSILDFPGQCFPARFWGL